jgi:hypothetical protein
MRRPSSRLQELMRVHRLRLPRLRPRRRRTIPPRVYLHSSTDPHCVGGCLTSAFLPEGGAQGMTEVFEEFFCQSFPG